MRTHALAATLAATLLGCGGRPEYWEAPIEDVEAVGLSGSVAVRDGSLDRLVMITSPKGRGLVTTTMPAGTSISLLQADPRGQRLFVLSDGALTRRSQSDEPPKLTVIDGGGQRPASAEADAPAEYLEPFVITQCELEAAASSETGAAPLVIDEEGEYAVLRVGGDVVENPNQILIVRLPQFASETQECDELEATTIRSFGSAPRRMAFTRRLRFPDKERRLLIVQTDREIALLDPAQPEMEVTIRLTESGAIAAPLEVIYDENQPSSAPDEARYPIIAVSMQNQSTVQMVSFAPLDAAPAGEDVPGSEVETKDVEFAVNVNLAEAGGVPSDIDFFWTEIGGAPALRIAALVPTQRGATLIDPTTSQTTSVGFDAAFTHMERITDPAAVEPTDSSVALLWSTLEPRVGFWTLTATGSSAYRSLESFAVDFPINTVTSISNDLSSPDATAGQLKILRGGPSSTHFYVLDLTSHETSPLIASPLASIDVSPDGKRLLAFEPNSTRFASVTLLDLRPETIELDRPITGLFDLAQEEGGRALVALHPSGGLGATVLDGEDPDSADTRFYPGLLLGGLR